MAGCGCGPGSPARVAESVVHPLHDLASQLQSDKRARRLGTLGRTSPVPRLDGDDLVDREPIRPSHVERSTGSVGSAAKKDHLSCAILESDAQQVYPGSKSLQLGPSQFPLTWFGVVKHSASRFNISLPGRYAWSVIDGYRNGRWDAQSASFSPRLKWSMTTTPAGNSYTIQSPFHDYVDYCGWWRRAWDWIDSVCPIYTASTGYGLDAHWAWQGVSTTREAWDQAEVFGSKEFLLRCWGFVNRHRHNITTTECCADDLTGALRTGANFSIGSWLEAQRTVADGEWEPLLPYGWTAGEQVLAATSYNVIQFWRRWTDVLASLASYWAHAAVTLYCFAFTWRSALGEPAFEELLGECQRCIGMVQSCCLVIGTTIVHELVHALKPAERKPSHIRRGCCHQRIAAGWAARTLYEERLFPTIYSRKEVFSSQSGPTSDWVDSALVMESDVGGPIGRYVTESFADPEDLSLNSHWLNTTTSWSPFPDVSVPVGSGAMVVASPVAFTISDCDGFAVRGILNANPMKGQPYASPTMDMGRVAEHGDFRASC